MVSFPINVTLFLDCKTVKCFCVGPWKSAVFEPTVLSGRVRRVRLRRDANLFCFASESFQCFYLIGITFTNRRTILTIASHWTIVIQLKKNEKFTDKEKEGTMLAVAPNVHPNSHENQCVTCTNKM